jgi:hypothetical protein
VGKINSQKQGISKKLLKLSRLSARRGHKDGTKPPLGRHNIPLVCSGLRWGGLGKVQVKDPADSSQVLVRAGSELTVAVPAYNLKWRDGLLRKKACDNQGRQLAANSRACFG